MCRSTVPPPDLSARAWVFLSMVANMIAISAWMPMAVADLVVDMVAVIRCEVDSVVVRLAEPRCGSNRSSGA